MGITEFAISAMYRVHTLRSVSVVIVDFQHNIVIFFAVDIGDATPTPRADTCNLSVLADESDIDDDQQDLFPKFCPHADKITMVYMMKESKKCMWSINARVLRADEFFYIRKWNREHNCGVAVRTAKNPRAGSKLVFDVISERVRDRPLTRPTDVVYDLKKIYGLEISYRVAWLGVEKACGEMFGAYSISFDQLRWYSNAVVVNNPGSYINIDYDEQNHRFEWFFTLYLFWFLQHLANVVSNDRTLTFLPDRHTGLIDSIPKIFSSAHHAFCLQHLQRNLQDKMRYVNSSYRAGLLSKFRACAYAPTVTGFNASIETFIKSGRNVARSFLKDILPRYWANAYFIYAYSLYT
ncbi:uncharacterized protein LOC114283949 [Camellia sinensis]|uniref:uncharacterized protein LOC114283949 n=1 Tax=Camellia sinensis TaxID=4442 RepID=UPI001035EE6A|nr:uncharacterized protein LOC114283949 [Camellia sinensis]